MSSRDVEADMQALILRDFPPCFMGPWVATVADAGLRWSWEARMRPLSVSGDEPIFTLTHNAVWGPTTDRDVGVTIGLAGSDQGMLLATARAIEAGWPL